MKFKIAILGAGAIGQVLAQTFRKNKHRVELWDINPKIHSQQKNLEKIIAEAQFIFLCFPSSGILETIKKITPFIKKETIIISLAKGIAKNYAKPINQILKENLKPSQPFALLVGPFLAVEIKNRLPALGVIATKHKKTFAQIKKLFEKTKIYLGYTNDVAGAALASSLKNIYAILLGIVDGLHLGNNAKGYLAAKAAEEMMIILRILRTKTTTALGPAGLGDLIATSFSPYSRNRNVGEIIGKTGKSSIKSEGFRSIVFFRKTLKKHISSLPLLQALSKIIIKKSNPRKTLESLIKKSHF